MDFDLEKKRVRLVLFIAAIIALSITGVVVFINTLMGWAQFRIGNNLVDGEMVGEEAASKSGKFTWLNCLDMGSGTLACSVKEGVKLYFYSFKSAHVELARNQAIESTLTDAVSRGLDPKDAAKQAQKEGKKAAKLASRQAKRVIGPIISSGWDFFEALYFGGSMTEGFLRGTGTLVGAYGGGFLGDQQLGRIGYLVGSHLGSWVGGRIGLMVYDVVNGVHFLLQFVQPGDAEISETPAQSSDDVYMESVPSDEL